MSQTGTGRPDPAIHWNDCREGLDPALAAAVEAGARQWRAAMGGCVEVTSGRRTLRQQARLMVAMSEAQLTALYGRQAVPDYVRDIRDLRGTAGTVSADQVYDILRNRGEGYISRHLFGAAVDLAVPEAGTTELVAALEQVGLAALDERDQGIHCLHVSLPGVPVRIVRD